MNNKFDQLIGDSKELKLNSNEKKDVRNQLKMHMAKEGVKLSGEERVESKHFLQMFIRRLPTKNHWIHFSLHSMTAAFAVFALFTGGLAYAAEDTIPGDALYSLKVDITEPLREHLKFSPEAKAEWNARRMERRLEEGQRLMSRGKGNFKNHLPKLQERLEMHTEKLEQRLLNLDSDDSAEEIRAHIESALEHHEAMLENIESGEVEPEQLRAFRKDIHKRRMKMHDFKRPQNKNGSNGSLQRKKDGTNRSMRMRPTRQ